MILDQQSLQILLKVPKKKYIRKLIEYAIALSYNPKACDSNLQTPIGNNFMTDLTLTSDQTHKLLHSLIHFISIAESIDFNEDKLKSLFTANFEEELKCILIELLIALREDIQSYENGLIRQSNRLIDLDWKLDMEIANQKGKANTPIVSIQLITAEKSQLKQTNLEMKGVQFQVFFKNLQKIKEQLSSLIKE